MKKLLKIVGIAVALIIVILIAIPLFLNVNTFRPKLESELTAALGREVKVGNLGLSIFSGSVSAEDLSIADDAAFSKDPFIKAKSLRVGVDLMPLIFSKQLNVNELTLEQPEIRLLKAESGKWNFSSIGSNKPAQKPAETKSSSSPTNFSVKKLAVTGGTLSVGKANVSKVRTYKDVNITVKDFSYTSQFPFTITADMPGGGDFSLDGQAGPIDATDASLTPLSAQVKVKKLDIAASGFVEPTTGISGIADFDGKLSSDGKQMHSEGTVHAEKLKLAEKGAPAGRPVEVKYAIDHNLAKEAGTLTQGDIAMGKALAKLTGSYSAQGEVTALNMKLNGQGMPVDELTAMLPALGVVLPSGSQLSGGTLSTTLGITGTTAAPVITGPIRLADTKLAGFNLGSKLSAISKLSGGGQGSGGNDTSIQNLSTDLRYAPSGIQTQNVNLTIPALGVLTGNGTVSPGGALDYKMVANLSGGAITGLTQMAGLGKGSNSLPFFIRGTTSNPSFVPDAQGLLKNQLGGLGGGLGKQAPGGLGDTLKGLFGKKKTK